MVFTNPAGAWEKGKGLWILGPEYELIARKKEGR